MKFKGVNHLAMATNDMDATIRFWRDLLGMRLVAGLGEPGYRHYFFEIDENDLIAFFEWSEVEPLAEKTHGQPAKGPFIFDHVAFGVEAQTNLWHLKEKLQAAGFDCSDVIDHGFIHSIYSFDPNGIPIEFSWQIKEIDIRRQPIILDAEPTVVAEEGADPLDDKWPVVGHPSKPLEKTIRKGAGSELHHFFNQKETDIT